MTIYDNLNAPVIVLWILFAIFAIVSIVLLSGHGANMIAGYNMLSKEKKAKYDEKKLCRVVGIGTSIISVLILGMALGAKVLPVAYVPITGVLVIIDCLTVLVLMNTICKKH